MIFYRYTRDGRRKTVDLRDVHSGALFLCGSHPSLRDEPLELLAQRGIVTMAMNNAALLVRPQLWVGADKPECYSRSILEDGAIVKFARLLYESEPIPEPGCRWRDLPATFFYGADAQHFHPKNLLDEHTSFVWWKNVFMIALQLAWELGFRTIYLAGVGMNVPPDRHYAFDSSLTPEQSEYSRRTYENVVVQVREALPHFAERGLKLVSCTPGSALNALVPFTPLRDAVAEVLARYPATGAAGVRHSSELVP